jgi:hypothetical protein
VTARPFRRSDFLGFSNGYTFVCAAIEDAERLCRW